MVKCSGVMGRRDLFFCSVKHTRFVDFDKFSRFCYHKIIEMAKKRLTAVKE